MTPGDRQPRYLLHQRLGAGGMAEVHLGTMVSPAGERLIAIKRLSNKNDAPAARQRLLAEARLVFQLTHANVCQVLDFGENDDGTFIVMEYVHGCDLGALLRGVRERNEVLDPAIALYVGREVARALDFAHRRTDASGRPLGLVHGDVSPRNVLLSVEGEVKLADFGIARAMGVVAPGADLVGGTPGFVAPEATSGVIDHRSDIFGLGASLERALGASAPAGASDEVRAIVARAKAPDPQARFPSAGEVERALALELARRHPEFTPSVLAAVVRRFAHGTGPVQAGMTGQGTLFAMKTLLDKPALATRTSAGARGHEQTATALPRRRRGRRQRWWVVVVPVIAAALAVVGASFLWGGSERAAVRGAEPRGIKEDGGASPAVAGTRSRPSVDQEPVGDTGGDKRPSVDPEQAGDTGDKRPSVDPERASDTGDKRPSVDRERRRRRRAPALEPAFLSVSAIPWGAVYIDGKRVARETPLYRRRIRPGRHVVRVRFGGTGPLSKPRVVFLEPGERDSIGFRK